MYANSEGVGVDPTLQSNVDIPYGRTDYNYRVGHRWVANQLLTLVCLLEERVETKDDNRASSRQWTIYKNLTLIHSREWSHIERNGDGIKTQFYG